MNEEQQQAVAMLALAGIGAIAAQQMVGGGEEGQEPETMGEPGPEAMQGEGSALEGRLAAVLQSSPELAQVVQGLLQRDPSAKGKLLASMGGNEQFNPGGDQMESMLGGGMPGVGAAFGPQGPADVPAPMGGM